MGESASFDGGSSELPTRALHFQPFHQNISNKKQGQESKDDKNTTSTFKIIQIQTKQIK